MKNATLVQQLQRLPLVLAILALGACTEIGTSRDVNNPNMKGETIALQVCSMCHGVTGESTSPGFPKLAGQQRDYILAQLADFKGHTRKDQHGTEYMWGYTRLTPAQMQEIATYFSSQAPMRAGRNGTQEQLIRGEKIFKVGIPENNVTQCSACHGAKGEGNGEIPRLAGQHANYLTQQIDVFKQTEHRPRGAAMKQVTHDMSASDIAAVTKYLESIGN